MESVRVLQRSSATYKKSQLPLELFAGILPPVLLARKSGTGRHAGRKNNSRRFAMNLHMSLSIAPVVALVAGLLILIVPRLLNYIVAIYLIITGLLSLFGNGGSFHLR
jgi:Protein of unknown function (DUF3096)